MTLLASLILLNVGLAVYANSVVFSCVLYGLAMIGIMSTILCGVTIGRNFIKQQHVLYLVDVALCFPKLMHLFLGWCYERAPTFKMMEQVANRVQEQAQPHTEALYTCGMFGVNLVGNILVSVVGADLCLPRFVAKSCVAVVGVVVVAERFDRTVSYTHLTLPTIYSV